MAHHALRRFAMFAAAMLVSSAALASPKIGAPAPEFTAQDAITGKEISLSDFKGKMVVLEWHNPECPFVKKFYSVGAMQQLQQNATKRGVIWIAVNSNAEGKQGSYESDDAAKQAMDDRNANATHYLRDRDGRIGKLYEAKTTPHMFVIDTDGKLAYMGAIDDTPTADSADIASAKNYVTRALDALSKGKKVAVTNSRPYGCFVKYAD